MILFISDLHLSPATPGITRIFLDFLSGRARAAEKLFILGDLFEAWAGDDCIDDPDDRFNASIVEALYELGQAGTRVFVMHGNRDFLVSDLFAQRTGATLLNDPHVLSVQDWQFLLSHGDALCTDDEAYQAFRRQVRTPQWKADFLSKPLTERKAIAAALRKQSEDSKREKKDYLMDMNPVATDDFLREHGYGTLIHGHTHRPATHTHLVDGIAVERWVLSDWHETQGECLVWDGEQLSRETLR